MNETVLVRFAGGILDGQTLQGHGWPPPDVLNPANFPLLTVEDGTYRKVSQSQLPEPVPGVLRGAQYEWAKP